MRRQDGSLRDFMTRMAQAHLSGDGRARAEPRRRAVRSRQRGRGDPAHRPMTAGSQRAALDAIHSARPIIARLSMARDSEDLAADLIEAWTATETGLRSLVGGSSLTGQMLIRELRQRHFLSLEQANALAEFHAARERAARVDYKPTEGDVNASRDAFLKLEAGLMGEPPAAAVPTPRAPRGSAAASAARAPRVEGGRVHAGRSARSRGARAVRGHADRGAARARALELDRAGARAGRAARRRRHRVVRRGGPESRQRRARPAGSRRIAKDGARPRRATS